jgi:hypothetical protein
VWKHPAEDDGERRFERFLFCWFFVGLVLFSIAAHQRGRLIFPLLPAAALLAGRELAWWLRGWSSPRLLKTAGAFAAVVLGLLFLYHHVLLAGSSRVQTTLGLRGVADRLDETLGAQFPVVYVDTPFALQFWLNTARPLVSFSNAAARLEANEPVIVAVSDFPKLEGLLATNQIVLHELARWPRHGTPVVRVVSNRPIPEARPRPAGPERAPHCCDEPRRSCAHNAIAPSSPAR